jgi:opacity protein-like surface antigen
MQTHRNACAVVSGALVMVLLAALPSSAQTTQPPAPGSHRQVGLTPFMAMGDDYALGGGASLSFRMAPRFTLEAEASVGVDAARSGVSVLFDVLRLGGVTTYAAAGAGVQRDELDDELIPLSVRLASRGPQVSSKKTELALGIGGGATVPVGPRWSYRVDFRWYNPKAEWPESWRIYNGLTVRLSGDR